MKESLVNGIQFLSNDSGKKVAVQIDLRKHGDLWEDFYDRLLAARRKNEPRVALGAVRRRLARRAQANG